MERISLKKDSRLRPTISAHVPILYLACVNPDSNLAIAATPLGDGDWKGWGRVSLTQTKNRISEVTQETGKIKAAADMGIKNIHTLLQVQVMQEYVSSCIHCKHWQKTCAHFYLQKYSHAHIYIKSIIACCSFICPHQLFHRLLSVQNTFWSSAKANMFSMFV